MTEAMNNVNVEILHILTFGEAPYAKHELLPNFHLRLDIDDANTPSRKTPACLSTSKRLWLRIKAGHNLFEVEGNPDHYPG
jgi:hypothetical protein